MRSRSSCLATTCWISLKHLRSALSARAVPGLEGLPPVADAAAVLGQLVEVRARDRDPDLLRPTRCLLVTFGPRNLDAVELHVAAPAQLQLEDELERRERRDLALEAGDALLDEGLGLGGRHRIDRICEKFAPARATEACGAGNYARTRSPSGS